jgi:hypothetical protein
VRSRVQTILGDRDYHTKVPFFIESKSDSLSKWLFFFRYLNRLKGVLPIEIEEIAAYSGLSIEDVVVLRSQAET